MKSKSQTSVELIIILAMLFIIIMIAVATFKPLSNTPNAQKQLASQAYWSTADIAILAWTSNFTNTTFQIQNNLNNNINITNISFDNLKYSEIIHLTVGEIKEISLKTTKSKFEQIEIKYINLKNLKNYMITDQNLFTQ